jgi:hypothetical protein
MSRSEHVLVDQTPRRGWRAWLYRWAVDLAWLIGRVFVFMRATGTAGRT